MPVTTSQPFSAEPSTDDVIARFLDLVVAGSGGELCSLFAPDAVLDATVPNWRFQVEGAEAIGANYARWFADPGRFEELERTPTSDGEVVTYLLTWEERGMPHAAHHCHRLTVRGGLIVQDTVFCGGRWPASLLAEMEAARAPGHR